MGVCGWVVRITGMALVLMCVTGLPSQAQTVLFGPTPYTRTAGPPNHFTATITLPAGTTPPYTLHIANGNADGTKRISSATIKLNGAQILGPNDFGQNVAVIDRTVALQASNQLEIRLTSAPGSFLTISVLDTGAGVQPTALTPNPLNLLAGSSGTLTATLAPAPTAAGTLAAASANPAVATVPASIPFTVGQTSVPVPVTAVASGSTAVTVTLNGGSAASQVTVSPPPSTITSFTPTSGHVGDAVAITGTNFINIQSVTFNGVAASTFTVLNATTINAVVPAGATTGKIAVTDAAGTATSAADFFVIPTLDQFTPTTGRLGTLITMTGTGFVPVPASNQVTIGGVAASVQSATPSQLIVSVPVAATTGPIAVTTAGGTATSATNFTVIAVSSLAVTPTQVTLPIGSTQPFHGTATFADQSTFDVTTQTTWTSAAPGTASVTTTGVAQGVALGTTTITGTLGSVNGSGQVHVIAASPMPLPPDPSAVAPPINPTTATSLADSTAFLYTGANPIQTGVTAGTIQAKQAAVLRGKVSTRDGFPLPGVTVTVMNHPEFGQTLTRPDGQFDLAVNGGQALTLSYSKTGFLPAQRQTTVPWQDFVAAPETILIPLDAQVTSITANAPTIQVARGSVVTDAAGTRQATVLFPANTTATMTFPGGGTQPLTTLNVRATEYTVGPTGPRAMPALLPPASAYTYAVEYSVDEALATSATSVQFNQPVLSYLENYLNLPIGRAVPSGSYSGSQGRWTASANGHVIKILTVTAGVADVDTNGDGIADNGLGMTTAERQQLGALYSAGQTLWRVPLTHFSPFDFNFWWALLQTLVPTPAPTGKPELRDEDCQTGSLMFCQTQTLGETLSLVGSPFALHYRSDRVPGRRDAYSLTVPVSGATVPAGLRRIVAQVAVAGRELVQTFTPLANQTWTVTWDGKDVYGRTVIGPQPAVVTIAYFVDAAYGTTDPTVLQAFARFPTGPVVAVPTGPFTEQALVQAYAERLGALPAPPTELGAWSLNVHHRYDSGSRMVWLGTGERRVADTLTTVITTVAGNGTAGFSGDGGPATQAQVQFPHLAVLGPDGSLYIPDQLNHRVRKVAPDGTITTIAGTGVAGYSGDGGPATAAQLNRPVSLVIAPDGGLLFSEQQNHVVRRIDPTGLITTVAGTGIAGLSGDGGPATAAKLHEPYGLALGPDGSLFIADQENFRIRQVGTDGLITTIAGTGTMGFSGDGGPAGAAQFGTNLGTVQVGPDGSLYVADLGNHRIRRIRTDGFITTVAGNGTSGFGGDGGPAISAMLASPFSAVVDRDGSLYIGDFGNSRIRRVGPDGIISTIVGSGALGSGGDQGPATAAQLTTPAQVSLGPDGNLYIGNHVNQKIRRVAPALPGFSLADVLIPAEDGSELYVFTSAGRHLHTLDALTGAVRYQFAYTPAGLLTTVTDADGKVTTVQRDGASKPTAIVAPGGQQTMLTLEGNGYLQSITNPNNETVELTYSADGLLATLKDARGNLHTNTYDAQGRLIKDEDPAGGFKQLTRTEQTTGWTVALSTALNRTTTYQVENLPIGD
ncbi:MAG: Ig-like domain-containing protein, partial [Nitrospira sp.]|nr:Ig-like domain-containing protein [Nitrospira sp.]